MKFLDVCAGIGGFRLALEAAGHECVGSIEIDKFARASYKAIFGLTGEKEFSEWEWHNVKSLSRKSLRKLRRRVGPIGMVCAGFPCQTFSFAGEGKGFADSRGTIFFKIAWIALILQPPYLFFENVKGLLSHDNGNTFETILRTLDELGYDVEWQVLNSKDYVPQNRERVFIIGHLRGASTEKIFPLTRDDETIDRRYGIEKIGNIRQKGKSQSGDVVSIDSIAPTLCSTTTQKDPLKILLPDNEATNTETDGRHEIVVAGKIPYGHDITSRIYDEEGISPALPTMQGGGQCPRIIQKPRGYNSGGAHDISPTLSCSSWQENNLLQVGGLYTNNSKEFNRGVLPDISRSIKAQNHDAGVTDGIRVRKLTPRECWRLQTFPDWAFDRAATVNSDSQLYKNAGNSVTVALVFDIARRFKEVH